MSVPSSSQTPMWANAMREILSMLGDAKDAASEALRAEAKDKLKIFMGWLDGSLPKPSDEERRELVREVTTLYRKAKTHAARYDNMSDESTERLIDPDKDTDDQKSNDRKSVSGR
jgi:hypothetical protein